MSISFRCRCGRVLKTKDAHAGRASKCPHCQTPVVVPGLATKPPPSSRASWVLLAKAFGILFVIGGLTAAIFSTILLHKNLSFSPTVASHSTQPEPTPTTGQSKTSQTTSLPPTQPSIKPVPPSAPSEPGAVEVLNRHRAAAGLPPVRLDPILSSGCQSHADYLVLNLKNISSSRFRLDDEDEQQPGFKEEGRNAAKASFCGMHPTNPGKLVDQWMASLFFRVVLLDPELQRVGWGQARESNRGWFGVFDAMRGRGSLDVVAYPASGQKNVPLAFPGNEVPDPIPEATQKKAGYPATVTFPRSFKVQNVTAVLRDDRGQTLPAWLSTPDQPAQDELLQLNSICLIAKEPLKPMTTFEADMRAKVNGMDWSRTWTFTTGKGERLAAKAKDVLECVNIHRQAAGLEPVTLDAGLSKGCLAHAEYLVANAGHPSTEGLGAHEESPERPGFTPEGQRAGKAADISFGIDPLASVDGYMSTFFHRIPLLDPELRRVGFGSVNDSKQGWVSVLDVNTGRGLEIPILCPAEDQTEVPLAYLPGEVPDPIPESLDKKAGYPVTLTFPRTALVRKAKARLLDGSGAEVPCWFSSPDQTAHPDYQRNTLCLLAKKPLQPAMKYKIVTEAEVDGQPWKKTWTFVTTGL